MVINREIGKILFAFLCGVLAPHKSFSAGEGDFRTTKINFFQTYYSGEENKSLGKGSPGYGVEFFRDGGGNIFRGYIKGRFGTSTGSQKFQDGSDSVTAQYNLYFGHGEIGGLLFPISRRDMGTNVYLGAGGFVSYNLMNLATSATTTTHLKTNQQAASYGYSALMGVEMVFGSGAGKHYMGTLEMSYRQEQTRLAGQELFDLSGLTLSVGLGW
ncbi:hypothetical protein [Bdellovibrio sp. HCB-110]|uniref:hypothetical protein n=1 Tax=Bdellovibrio sp. HCB-110 TaxID=3391182 RepID=UPI0039B5F741